MIVIFDPLDLKVSALDEVGSEFCQPIASDETWDLDTLKDTWIPMGPHGAPINGRK